MTDTVDCSSFTREASGSERVGAGFLAPGSSLVLQPSPAFAEWRRLEAPGGERALRLQWRDRAGIRPASLFPLDSRGTPT